MRKTSSVSSSGSHSSIENKERETLRERERKSKKSASWVKGHAHLNLQHVPDQFVSDFIKNINS